jgi:dipeptidase
MSDYYSGIRNSFYIAFSVLFTSQFSSLNAQIETELIEHNDACTIVTVGKKASVDGSVMNSQTLDGHRYRTWIDIQPANNHKKGSLKKILKRVNDDDQVMPLYKHIPAGEIPEAEKTYGYINSSMRCMNEHQLAIGESTFGGRDNLRSENGIIMVEQLTQLVMERCKTAREAIRLAGELTKKYGWIDTGECLTFADIKEVWHFEIVGPGKGNLGSIWAARRVPDHEISCNANASRIRQIDLNKPDYFIASENVYQVAQDSGWWNPDKGPFEFCYAYDPGGRRSLASRRREWRIFDLLAPSLDLDPNAENYPFSVKPDTLVAVSDVVRVFQDYYEGTDFNPVKNITWQNKEGKTEISPLANPFMPYDMNPLFKINGGWGKLGERTIARWYTIYGTITQSRDWLPDPVGGLVWLAWDNIAASIYTPLYCGITDLPKSFKTPGRKNGYTTESAWWAFNRLSTLAAQRWGDMRHDLEAAWGPWQKELFDNQTAFEKQAVDMYKKNPDKARKFLTDYSTNWGNKIVNRAWKLGDELWTKYDEKF